MPLRAPAGRLLAGEGTYPLYPFPNPLSAIRYIRSKATAGRHPLSALAGYKSRFRNTRTAMASMTTRYTTA
jgi:hypothetical protein